MRITKISPARLLAALCCVLLILAAAMTRAAEEEEKPAEPQQINVHTFLLVNSDRLKGDLQSIANGRASLIFHPTETTNKHLTFDLAKAEHIHFGAERVFREDSFGERLRLRDGSLLYGKFLKLTDTSLHFEFEEGGELKIPRAELVEFIRGSVPPTRGRRDAMHHVVYVRNGDVLSGDLSQPEEGSLAVTRDDLKATVFVDSIASILFPFRDEPAADDGVKTQLRAAVNTRRGNLISGTEPVLMDKTLSLKIVGGQEINLPVEEIVDMSITAGGAPPTRRQIIAWGRNCDREGEFRNTVNIVKEYLPAWRVLEDFSDLDENFEETLMQSGVWLMPEMETFRFSGEKLNTRFKELAEVFLNRGGRIVILGVNNHGIIGFLKATGMADLDFVDYNRNPDSQGATVPFTEEGHRIARGIGDSFVTANSTYFFTIKHGIKVTPWARSSSGVPIMARRAGLDWVIMMGMDYHEHSEQTERILINAITYR